ncbi:uncharacterized protein LOC125498438 [Beta vulgaris subsp. vulgaris]|uniref:uncharacterized protein LOC125498438 n=1 Tax=Beta vulgaris subsp. vulgaris TaxID=3555 RepID=UPI002036C457|nr:uncharacterized protein LOC125498438 [Beta vulgaris subsp. vulgaris]
MVYHKLTVCASYHLPDGPDVPLRSFGGGLICNRDGEWIIGISMCLHNDIYFDSDCTIPFYIVLLEGLELAWLRGFRYLEVNLGFVFHHSFWSGFTKDVVTKKFRLCVTSFSAINPRLLVILKTVEDYLNREWFIEVKNTELFGEEAGVLTVALMADCQDQAKKIYDFRTHPLNTGFMSTDMMNMVSEIASYVIDKSAYNASVQEKKYFGLN